MRLFAQVVFVLVLMLAQLAGCERKPAAVAASAATTPAPGASVKIITVFAAASATDVIREAARRFEIAKGVQVALSFDSSSNLARQIKAGAPVDVFISADEQWMNELSEAGEIEDATRDNLLGNQLVLVAPVDRPFTVTMAKGFDFAANLPQVERMAIADPSHVPAGRYSKQALEAMGWWSELQSRMVSTQNVRAALRLVEDGEVDAAIVYTSDLQGSAKIVLVGEFPADSHEPVCYPVALCRDARAGAQEFLHFLRSEEMVKVFETAGFRVIPPRELGRP